MSTELPFAERHFSRATTVDSTIKINNPFKNQLLEDVDDEAKAFAHLVNEHPSPELLRVFRIAGRISFNPRGWEEGVGQELSEEEGEVLRLERSKGLFQQPKTTKLTVLALWLSAIIQGWIQSTLNGANLNWWLPSQTDFKDRAGDPSARLPALWWFSATNALVFFVASAACGLSDPLQSRFFGTRGLGRRDMLFVAASISFATSIGAACVHKWTHLLACRVLLGIAMGLKASVTSIFAAEISTCHLRGTIVMSWQVGDTFGIFLGFTANLIATSTVGESSWRWQTVSAAIPSLILMILAWAIPDSPRLYLKKGEYNKAYTAMCQLRATPLQAARDLFYANAQLQVESEKMLKHIQLYEDELPAGFYPAIQTYQEKVKKLSWWDRIWALAANRRTRRALQSSLIVMIAQQLCGFNVLAFYSNTFFHALFSTSNSKKDELTTSLLSWGIGLVNFMLTIPAFWLIDPFGRVALLFATYPAMIVFMLGTDLTFACATGVPKVAVEALVFCFTAAYSLGQGPVAFTYAAEVFPLLYRESGMSVAVAANLFGAGVLTMCVPRAEFVGGSSWPSKEDFNDVQAKMLGTFVVLEVFALIMIFLFVPETAHLTPSYEEELNHLSLEELNSVFEQPTFHHTHYRIRAAFPSWLKRIRYRLLRRYIRLNDEDLKKPPFVYRWSPNDANTELQNIRSQTGRGASDSHQQAPAPSEGASDTRTGNSSRHRGQPSSRRPASRDQAAGGERLMRHEQQREAPSEDEASTRPNNRLENRGKPVWRKPVAPPQANRDQPHSEPDPGGEQAHDGSATPTTPRTPQRNHNQDNVSHASSPTQQRTSPANPQPSRLSFGMYDTAHGTPQGNNGGVDSSSVPSETQQHTLPAIPQHGHLSFDMYNLDQSNQAR